MKNFEEIYKQYSNDIFKYIMFKTGSKEKSEDITSETFLNIYIKENIQEIKDLKAYLIGTARNLIYKNFNKEFKNIHLDSEDYEYLDEEISMEEAVLSEELINLVENTLKELDDNTKEIIILKIWEDLKFTEIAEILKTNENTIKTLYYRGINNLKSKLNSNRVYTFSLPTLLFGLKTLSTNKNFLLDSTIKENIFTNLVINSNSMLNDVVTQATAEASKNTISTFLQTTVGKIAIIGVSTVVVTGGGVGVVTYVQSNINNRTEQDIQNKNDSNNDSDKEDDNNKAPDDTSNCIKKETINGFKDLTVEYDSCYWTIDTQYNKDNFPEKITFTSEIGTLVSENYETMEGYASCFVGDYTKIENLYRITSEKVTTNTDEQGPSYFEGVRYVNYLAPKGSEDWQAVEESFLGYDYSETDYCTGGETFTSLIDKKLPDGTEIKVAQVGNLNFKPSSKFNNDFTKVDQLALGFASESKAQETNDDNEQSTVNQIYSSSCSVGFEALSTYKLTEGVYRSYFGDLSTDLVVRSEVTSNNHDVSKGEIAVTCIKIDPSETSINIFDGLTERWGNDGVVYSYEILETNVDLDGNTALKVSVTFDSEAVGKTTEIIYVVSVPSTQKGYAIRVIEPTDKSVVEAFSDMWESIYFE